MALRQAVCIAPTYKFTAHEARVKLDQNESAYDLPPELKTRALERLAQLEFNRYPEIAAHSLRGKLAQHYHWPETGLVLSSGSNVLIQALVIAAGLEQQVLTVSPTFSVYPLQAQLLGAELLEIPLLADFSLDMPRLERALAQGQGIFFLANPAAPTGNLFDRKEVQALADASQQNWLFVIDEAYHQFSGTSFLDLAQEYPHVISLRTFSKAFGLGGIRLGYALMKPSLAEHIQKLILPFSVSAVQTSLGELVLDNLAYVRQRIDEVLAERARVFAELAALPELFPYPTVTNFILFKVKDASGFYQGLLSQGILIRRQDHLPGLANCLRVSIGTPEENSAFLEAARKLAS